MAPNMAWSVPRDWVTDEVPTAATMNTHIRDNLMAAACVAGLVNPDGTRALGSNYNSTRTATGTYVVTFSSAIAGGFYLIPSIMTVGSPLIIPVLDGFDISSFTVEFRRADFANALLTDVAWCFVLRPAF